MRRSAWDGLIAIVCLVIIAPAPLAQAGSAVNVSAYPVVAGQTVTVQYDPAGRVLDGTGQVYLHYGFDGWDPTISPDPAMTWNSAESVWEVTIDVPTDVLQLDVVFTDGYDTWDNNSGTDWHLFVVSNLDHWVIDGQLDDAAFQVATNGDNRLYAGVRGTTLYIAAPGASSGNDHFIFVTTSPGSLTSAPWDKGGNVAAWSAYIGNEVDSAWVGWFDATGTTDVATGTWVEGTIDLAEQFGSVPSEIYVAFAAYETADSGVLQYALQLPASQDSDGDVDADEYVQINLSAITVGCAAFDLDLDCDLDADDLDVFATMMAGPDNMNYEAADIDNDGDVDLADFVEMQLAIGGPFATDLVVAEDLGTDVTRFYPTGTNLDDLPASLSLAVEPVAQGAAAMPWVIEPQFFQTAERHVAVIPIDDDISLYGTGEVCGGLLRNGHTTEAWNTDYYGYGPTNPSLYQSHPWVLAVRPDGSAFGVLADTTYRCMMDLSVGILFAAEGPQFPLYVFEGDSPQAVLTRLTDFIGRMEMPPLWALGYQQSRYSYFSETYALWLGNEFRNRDIPCDVIWFDIDYMDDYRIFTFNPTNFPNPWSLNNNLHGLGYHTVWMIDPGAKVDSGYFVYDQGCAGDHWIYDSGGGWYTGEVWPGNCHFPDFTRPDTRAWWGSLYSGYMANGIDGVWNDMNEPGIFDGPGHSMPTDCWHRGGGELEAGPHNQYHNVYGMLMSQASREGILAAKPDNRPFVLSRASFIGGHRYAAMWTGDNTASWDHLFYSTPMVLNMGLSGQPFAGPDLGGFVGDPSGELMARWMGIGVFMPFCRAHYDGNGSDQEPWVYGTEVENACRTAIQRRYRLLPYLYTLFQESATNGLPVTRPVYFADPADPDLRSEDIAFMLGADLLVVPNVSEDPGWAPTPALPDGVWRTISLVGEDSANDVTQPDLRVRDGAIIPAGPVMEYTGEFALDPLTLIVSLDASGYAEGWLYEDDGDGFDYLLGDYRLARYTATQSGSNVTIEVAEIDGTMATPSRTVNVEIVTDSGVVYGSGSDVSSGTITVITLP